MNKEELEQHIYTYGKDLFYFCRFLAYSHQEAEDLYQDTFVKLYELNNDIDFLNNPKSFLMTIAINQYRNQKRKVAIHEKIIGKKESIEDITELPSKEQLTEEKIVQRELEQTVRRLVYKLPDKYRLPILLFYMEDLSIDEISTIILIPVGTVKTRIFRAKKILKRKLEELNYEK